MVDSMINVFIVDDHAIFREGLKKVLSAVPDIAVVGEAADGPEALDRILGGTYDVVVLDLGLPGLSGFDVLRTLKAKRPSLPIIVMSIHTEEEYAVMVLKAGGSGYLTKESVPADLIKAIRKAGKGETYVSESLGERFVEHLRGGTQKKLHESLTAKEYQVFSLIVMGKSVKEISSELSLARPTVSTYRSRILQKMKMNSNAELARYAATHNLVD
jgi:two-component system, NarL family, invasion response regulator UvrY